MKFLEKIKHSQTAKFVGIALGALIVLSFVSNMFGVSLDRVMDNGIMPSTMQSFDMEKGYYGGDDMMSESGGMPGLSTRNVETSLPQPPEDVVIPGDDAEEYEVTEYSATIETWRLDATCTAITDMKAKEYIIFESATRYDTGCNYTFKVRHDHVPEVLASVKDLDPRELSENTYTIKQLVTDYTSEIDILQKQLATIDATLTDAVASYNDITALATRIQDAESLAKIIDSKIGIIERLTQKKITISAQLETLERAKADALDRLDYTYFHVYVSENKFIDGEALADSWKYAVRSFVGDMNGVAQDITINLISFIFIALQYAIYLFLLVIIAKYGWRLVRYVWDR